MVRTLNAHFDTWRELADVPVVGRLRVYPGHVRSVDEVSAARRTQDREGWTARMSPRRVDDRAIRKAR